MLLRQLWWVVSMDPRRRRKRAGLGDSEHNWPLPQATIGIGACGGGGRHHRLGDLRIAARAQLQHQAFRIYGHIPGRATAPHQVRTVHRTCGIILFLATLPVAVHCMFAYGVQTTSARVTIHSLAGCFFYGVFTAKVLVVRNRQQLGWAIPVAGGLLVTLVAVLWYR